MAPRTEGLNLGRISAVGGFWQEGENGPEGSRWRLREQRLRNRLAHDSARLRERYGSLPAHCYRILREGYGRRISGRLIASPLSGVSL